MRIMRIFTAMILVFVPAFALAGPDTDLGYRGWGPRLGITSNPDQMHFGVHTDFGSFSEHVWFRPNFELGLGDNMTFGALNFEAAYRFSTRWDAWGPYVGGGVGLNFIDRDGRGRDGVDTDSGLNGLVGIERGLRSGDRFFTELKLGLTDSPDFKLTSGWTFYH